jgi:hypothetical protein
VTLCRPIPWDRRLAAPRPWATDDDRAAALWLQEQGIHCGSGVIRGVVDMIARRAPYHPVVDYARSLAWDGRGRVGDADTKGWLSIYTGTDDTPSTRAIGASWLLGAVDRIYNPGHPAPALVLGGRGDAVAKAEVIRILGGRFGGTIDALHVREARSLLAGAWFVHIGRFDLIARGDQTPGLRALRLFTEACNDHRALSPPVPRQCVFAAASDHDEAEHGRSGLGDWPFVRCGRIDLAGLARDRDQILAEVFARYARGERPLPVERLVPPAPIIERPPPSINGFSSIVSLYAAERLVRDPVAIVAKDVLYLDHLRWREARGLDPVKKDIFARYLHAVLPGLIRYRPGNPDPALWSGRRQMWRGVRLK